MRTTSSLPSGSTSVSLEGSTSQRTPLVQRQRRPQSSSSKSTTCGRLCECDFGLACRPRVSRRYQLHKANALLPWMDPCFACLPRLTRTHWLTTTQHTHTEEQKDTQSTSMEDHGSTRTSVTLPPWPTSSALFQAKSPTRVASLRTSTFCSKPSTALPGTDSRSSTSTTPSILTG